MQSLSQERKIKTTLLLWVESAHTCSWLFPGSSGGNLAGQAFESRLQEQNKAESSYLKTAATNVGFAVGGKGLGAAE